MPHHNPNRACPFGTHRVLKPTNVLPQAATKLDVSLPILDNELLIDVEALNIDSASFMQMRKEFNDDETLIARHIQNLISIQGKQQNPVTGSGGVLIGRVREVGVDFLKNKSPAEFVKVGDRVVTLVSLTLTPLHLTEISKVHMATDRVDCKGHAILFESGVYAKLPNDIHENLALAVLDVCGAPAQAAKLCAPGQTVVAIGGGGKSGILSLWEAKKKVGVSGRVIALDYSADVVEKCKSFSFIDDAYVVDATNSLAVYDLIRRVTNGRLADIVFNFANIPNTEMATILGARSGGTAYYFSMATNFAKATLGAEGVGANVTLLMGNGYTPGHAELTLQILRDSSEIRSFYEAKYGST